MPEGECPVKVRYYKAGICETTHFTAALSSGVPLCVEGLEAQLQGEWYPSAFVEKFPQLEVSPIDCLTDEEVQGRWTVADFFPILDSGDTSHGTLKLKVSYLDLNDARLITRLGLASRQSLSTGLGVSQ